MKSSVSRCTISRKGDAYEMQTLTIINIDGIKGTHIAVDSPQH